jgi:2-polyprenyl-3-methyl-5-hydroxy-6-metoxy-1,4-benzoquinol methylase
MTNKERQKVDKTEKFWDRLSTRFDTRAEHYEQTTLKTIENSKKYLKVSDVVLDYGCATGTITCELAGNVKEIHGIDISSKMIEAAQRKAVEQKIKNIDFAQATIFDNRYGPDSFDVILALNIIHLVEDTRQVMQRLNELLRSGGLMISATACLGEKRTFSSTLLSIPLFLSTKLGLVPRIRFFKIPELEDAMTKGNFKIVETEILTHNPATEYFIVAKKI